LNSTLDGGWLIVAAWAVVLAAAAGAAYRRDTQKV
jgi:hypothetical protein